MHKCYDLLVLLPASCNRVRSKTQNTRTYSEEKKNKHTIREKNQTREKTRNKIIQSLQMYKINIIREKAVGNNSRRNR